MIRYHLDDLGWYQFEALVQSLLKADLGLAVESWGGHSDRGRDAFAHGPLSFPDKNVLNSGPFLFQVKFVQGANASGAKPASALLTAVSAEAEEIRNRRSRGLWEGAEWYVLLTNAPLHTSTRKAIVEIIQPAIFSSNIVSLGAKDICDLLDNHPNLRAAFPEIMSLRDLDTLLQEVVNKTILQRSKSAIDEARDISSRFVQTSAYFKALTVLRKHRFVVLDGPPEMGKTAIARIISLIQLTFGWQAVDCRNPDDFFQAYDRHNRQIFVADDAFGRTEYDPTLGRQWEKDLAKVLNKLDRTHWLIWTTRKHILNRALKDMDLIGKASDFPEPGEVIVTADKLSVEEKSRILYRHARAGNLEETFRTLVKQHARIVVMDKHFTPERIRRFVDERIPTLAHETAMKPLSGDELRNEIVEAIRNPTKRMRKAFNKLPATHRWLLISLLDSSAYPTSEELKTVYNRHRPELSQVMLADALDDLVGTFVKYSNLVDYEYVDWIHPSYRDLVIDELTNDLQLQATFLRNASLPGLQLALSEAGGGTGARDFPFLGSDAAWQSLRLRAEVLANQGVPTEVQALLILLTHSLRVEAANDHIKTLISETLKDICKAVRLRWSTVPVKVDPLNAYFRALSATGSEPSSPNMELSWEFATTRLREMLDHEDYLIDETIVGEWTSLADLIKFHALNFFEQPNVRANFKDDFALLSDALDRELDEYSPDEDELSEQAERIRSIARSVSEFEDDDIVGGYDVATLTSKLKSTAEHYEESIEERGDDYDPDEGVPVTNAGFSIEAFFVDL